MLQLENVWMQVNNGNGENKEILKGVDLEFQKGKLYGITGPNGGGKTSIAKIIMGIYKQSQGHIILNGRDISEYSVSERAKLGIGYAFQQPPRFKGLTIEDMFNIASPDKDHKDFRLQMRNVGLCPEDYLDRELNSSLSGGEIKRVEMAQLLLRNLAVTIFDEPEAGVDLWTIQKLITLIIDGYKHNPDKLAIVITHNENILPICDEIIVVEDGIIKAHGRPKDVWPLIRDDIECKIRNQCQGEMLYEY